jgi:hypothetical protein
MSVHEDNNCLGCAAGLVRAQVKAQGTMGMVGIQW